MEITTQESLDFAVAISDIRRIIFSSSDKSLFSFPEF